MQSWLALLMLAYSGKKVPRMCLSLESSSVTGLYHVRKSLQQTRSTIKMYKVRKLPYRPAATREPKKGYNLTSHVKVRT